MKLLLDQGTPRSAADLLRQMEVNETIDLGAGDTEAA